MTEMLTAAGGETVRDKAQSAELWQATCQVRGGEQQKQQPSCGKWLKWRHTAGQEGMDA